MRAIAVVLVLLLAGCSAPRPDGDPPEDGHDHQAGPMPEPAPFDALSEHLPANSTDWQPFLLVEDEVLLGNGSMQFTTGRGMACQGDVDNATAVRAGWVVCMVRLADRPAAVAQGVRELGIGYDVQRLTARQASAPVEWRVQVLADAEGSLGQAALEPVFDSGWRGVDLSPAISDPSVEVEVRDPCDRPDPPVDPPRLGPQAPDVDAVITVEVDATHGQPFIRIDLGPSRAGDATSTPFAAHGTLEHGFEARWETAGAWRNYTLELIVDIVTAATASGPAEGPCAAVIGRETQEWIVDVGIFGADGKVEYKTQTLLVDVYLTAA